MESPARKNRSARSACWVIESFCGAGAPDGAAASRASAARIARVISRSKRVAHAAGADKIHQPGAAVRQGSGDVERRVPRQPVAREIGGEVDEEIDRR